MARLADAVLPQEVTVTVKFDVTDFRGLLRKGLRKHRDCYDAGD